MTGRFAPSPSGPLHLGSLRTALLSWLFARSEAGAWLVRIEDLDRTAARFADQQLADLAKLGLISDKDPVIQSQRRPDHDEAIEDLIASGRTYPCFCTRREIAQAATAPHGSTPDGTYPGTCRGLSTAERDRRARSRPPAIRFDAGGAFVRATDELLGDIGGEVDDFVIRRFDGTPAYNLAVVVDDAHQEIDQVVRGDDLAETTKRQVLLATELGVGLPRYFHVPLVLGPDGRRLAKRDGAVTLADRATRGESPAAVLSMLGRSLGLAEPDEAVELETLLARFDPGSLPRHPWQLEPTRL